MNRLGVGALALFFLGFISAGNAEPREPVRAVYLGSNSIRVSGRVQNVIELLRDYEINAVVVDKKDDNGAEVAGEEYKNLVAPFKALDAYVLCRIVTFKDNVFARANPQLAVRSKSRPAKLWIDDGGNHFLDPALPEVAQYLIEVSLRAASDGCDELNYDYIRFPSDGPLRDAEYPSGNYTPARKREAMRKFLAELTNAIRARYPQLLLSADVFGYAAMGRDPGIGQFIEDFAEHGFGIYPMAYPSHYFCNEFGAPDPNKIPYTVYKETLTAELRYLKARGYASVKIRPWLQGFTRTNIYGCGLDEKGRGVRGKRGDITNYADSPNRFREQIRALQDVIKLEEFREMSLEESWIVWHSGGKYNKTLFRKKRP